MPTFVRLLPLTLAVLAACKSGGDDTPDSGTTVVEDLCNSREEALSQPECELKPGEPLERLLALETEPRGGDQDWYRIVLPPGTNARTLLNVNGTYLASSTAVNLSITVLGTLPNGQEGALAKKEDKHGQGAPRPVDIVLPLRDGMGGQTLLVLVQDAPDVPSRPNFDARNKYRLSVRIDQNPDEQEPNDTPETATPLVLTQSGEMLMGATTGYLATDNDVDHYAFDLAAGQVAYVHIIAPNLESVPNWRLSYELWRPTRREGQVDIREKEDEGVVLPQVRGGELATARKIQAGHAGRWTLVVKGYRGINDRDTAQGDLTHAYEVEVRVMEEEDAQDRVAPGNDNAQHATVRSLESATPGGAGASVAITGRLGYVSDRDWYDVRLPAFSVPTLLRYRLVPLETGGRFPPLPATPSRVVHVFTLVNTGATLDDWRENCATNAAVCPRDFGENPDARGLVDRFCRRTDLPAPMCVHSSREEVVDNPRFTALSNFRGVIPVPAHSGALRYFFLVQDNGSWTDDKDYRLEVSWEPEDADELSRYVNGVEAPVSRTMASTTAFPAPPDTAEFSVTGQLSHGHGRLRSGTDRVNGFGVRGPVDYDAVPSDVDSYVFDLPSVPPPEDRTWLLQWEVAKLTDGGTPHGLALDLTFCDGDRLDSGTCTPVRTGNRGPLTLGYRSDALRAWHTPANAGTSSLQPLYRLEDRPNSTVVTLAPYACGCLERRFIRGGTLRVDVTASERLDYERVNYTLRTGHGDYPQSYPVDGGTTVSCPVVTDGGTTPDGDGGVIQNYAGGCNFTFQP
ncbi:hypothetical protein [Comamonas sp. JC664]|uniref:hypothetical protein n=1 Tax=Comamonas sp. JC664 TaxID=2801917 RepID=UPI00174EBC7E|nr:hypothetical protein [Comamonas sp. JC664]MBL0697653.1 hypothetical protein [Comamonas sp. JC664]GHG68845.1 hypothetical protein GCM10012319_12450 [Comamonas sp. KCTC 72670]